MTFRAAALADAPAIAEIERLSFSHPGEQFSFKKVRYLLSSRRNAALVAEAGGEVLGWCVGFVWTRGPRPWGRIFALAVHPKSRGRKLGPRLAEQLIAVLRARGAGPIFLEVRADNHAAAKVYERLGFIHCTTLGDYYAPGLHANRMVLRESDAFASAPTEAPRERGG